MGTSDKPRSANSNASSATMEEDVLSFKALEAYNDTDSDKDLVIHSLYESLHIHKDLLERIHIDKDEYIVKLEEERAKAYEEAREAARLELDDLQEEYSKLEELNRELKKTLDDKSKALDDKKEEFSQMESKYREQVKRSRAMDEDPSTIHSEMNSILQSIYNFANGFRTMLRAKEDRERGTEFVWRHWPEKEDAIRENMLQEGEDALAKGYVIMFLEKFLADTIIERVLTQPIHLGVSVNDAYDALETWVRNRNSTHAVKLRQMINTLIVTQANEEDENIKQASADLVNYILDELITVFPELNIDTQRAKLEAIVAKAEKQNKAIKDQDQDITIGGSIVEEGQPFNRERMKLANKSAEDGSVFVVITPAFYFKDEVDSKITAAKVFCIADTAHSSEQAFVPLVVDT